MGLADVDMGHRYPHLTLVEPPLLGWEQGHSFRRQICGPFSYLTRNQGSCTAGTEALGLWDESFMGRQAQGALFPCFPTAVPALLGPAIWERSCSYGRGGAGLLLLLSMSLSSRDGPALYGSIGPLIFPVEDWSFVTILHSYMSPCCYSSPS